MKRNSTRLGVLLAAGTLASTLTILPSLAQEAKPEAQAATAKLDIGSSVPELKGITWLQGEPVNQFDEAGKVYMLELWATWCGPCVQIIPHVNDLHKKYADKGLVIVGMNVWEDDIDTPKKFLADQGEAMSYRVAFSGGGDSDFSKSWLKPAEIQGIPHALIIKDGKIIFKGHPAMLEDTTIEQMLAGSYDPVKAQAEAAAQEKAAMELRNKVMPLFQSGDWDGVLKLANALEENNPAKLQLQVTALTRKNDWKGLLELRSKLSSTSDAQISATDLDQNSALSVSAGEGAKEYATLALKDLADPSTAKAPEEATHLLMVSSRLNFLAGNLDAAKVALDAAIASLDKVDHPQMKQQLQALLPLAKTELEAGKFPSLMELSNKLAN